MGSVFKKTVTRPMPPGAETIVRQGVRLARWKASNGRTKTAPITTGRDGAERIRDESGTYFARYRDGIVIEAATGCRDESAARQVLANLERRSERVRSGLITSAESRIVEHLTTPIAEHVAGYITSLEASGASPKHVGETRRVLKSVLDGCGFGTLAAIERAAVENWLNQRRRNGASARTRNIDLTHLIAFANWCVTNGRLTGNPFRGITKSNEAETRRRRRAMTEAELIRLLDVARNRPLTEALTVRRGKRAVELYANVRDEVRERLDRLGRERALIYKALVLTGLRKNELATLTAGQLRLDGPMPHVELNAADEKNREGNGVVIRPDLANDLRLWLADKLTDLQTEARRRGEPIPARLPSDSALFEVPDKLIKIFDRDLKAAGIAKRDERGRTLDVHALRTTFGTLLSKGGVSLRTAQAAMRHSDPSLTANVYTDPKLLDVSGALDALPSLPLKVDNAPDQHRATETETYGVNLVALPVALTHGNGGKTMTTGDKKKAGRPDMIGEARLDATVCSVKDRGVLTTPDTHPSVVGDTGFEPVTPSVSNSVSASPKSHRSRLPILSYRIAIDLQSGSDRRAEVQGKALLWSVRHYPDITFRDG
jgi:integrase